MKKYIISVSISSIACIMLSFTALADECKEVHATLENASVNRIHITANTNQSCECSIDDQINNKTMKTPLTYDTPGTVNGYLPVNANCTTTLNFFTAATANTSEPKQVGSCTLSTTSNTCKPAPNANYSITALTNNTNVSINIYGGGPSH